MRRHTKVSDYIKNQAKEEAFKKRYNRNVEVYQWSKNPNEYTIKILCGGKEYLLTEHLDKGAPKGTVLSINGKEHRYPFFVFAEIHVADDIGEQEE